MMMGRAMSELHSAVRLRTGRAAAVCLILGWYGTGQAADPQDVIVLNDDGAWCWFQDERAVISNGRLFVGSVANGTYDPGRTGDVDVTVVELRSGAITRHELFDHFQADDHNVPALWIRPDAKVLAVFARHGPDPEFFFRRTVDEAGNWGPLHSFAPSANSRITYANLLFLSDENDGQGRLYNFFRGYDASFKPSYAWSDDYGKTWRAGNVVINVPSQFRHRPYVRYAADGRSEIHLFYTDGHPRDFDNSLYHVRYRDGWLHTSDGQRIQRLQDGLRAPGEGTQIFRGDAEHVAWVSDAHLSSDGQPHVVFSEQRGSAGLKSGDPHAGQDHRYHYASWDGRMWQQSEIAFGGSRLYVGEDDYTGNLCLDPANLNTVYASTNVDPVTNAPLLSAADGQQHYELFRGTSDDRGRSWSWEPLTKDSRVDNLRPVVPVSDDQTTRLLWFRGSYRTYRDYQTEVVMMTLD